MTEAFECPHCGAPLDYSGTGETMRCPFCGNSVIVPPELRVAAPPPPPPTPPRIVTPPPVAPPPPPRRALPPVYVARPMQQPAPPPRRKGGCSGLGVLIILALVGVPLLASMPTFWRMLGRAAALRQAVPTLVAAVVTQGVPNSISATARAVLTEVASGAPTPNAQATRQALQADLNGPRSWPVLISDGFARPANGWPTGDVSNQYLTGTRQIAAGKYHWSITAKTGMYTYAFPDMSTASDLYAGVDVLITSMPRDGQAGLVFRRSASRNAGYVFALKPNNTYALTMFDGQTWTQLIGWKSNVAIHAGRTNRLEVSAQGSQLVLLINKQVVDFIDDSRLAEGDVGLGVDLANAQDQAEVDFGNFEVRAPAQ
jgi:hypothetical protein